jgi:hypothetical protein
MNQTKKRLNIINLAISITDIETIQLQILKLGPLRSDSKIQEIITMLQTENYAQAQTLITTYIEAPTEEILQRSLQEDEALQRQKDEEIIEEFDLFVEEPQKTEKTVHEINDLNAFIESDEQPTKLSDEQVSYDSLLNVNADEILPDNIELDISHMPKNNLLDNDLEISTEELSAEEIAEDTFFNKSEKNTNEEEEDTFFDNTTENTETEDKKTEEESFEKEVTLEEQDTLSDQPEENREDDTPKEELKNDTSTNEKRGKFQYKPISYITQKFGNMFNQYSPIEIQDKGFSSVDTLLNQISQKGYNDQDIEEKIEYIEKYSLDKKAEAAELLLLCAATESKYARFQLARALYKGEILVQNIPESFSLMNSLALNDGFPEAICDLGQFYEYGIGTEQKLDKAKLLYKEAMDLGIKRASTHCKRLNEPKLKLFSIFKK